MKATKPRPATAQWGLFLRNHDELDLGRLSEKERQVVFDAFGPEPGMQLFYDRQRERAIIHGFRLPQVPENRAYQLWFIRDGKPVPSVTFKPEADGHARVEQIPVPAGGDVSAAAVTVEPESGSTQPTMPIFLVGPLKRS